MAGDRRGSAAPAAAAPPPPAAAPPPPRPKPPAAAAAASGALSGAFISAIVQPLDVVRTRMQADAAGGALRGTITTLRTVLSERGLAGLWMGTGPTVVRLSAGAGLHMMLLEHLKSVLQERAEDGSVRLSAVNAALAGGLSRALAAAALCPITVVKTRMEYGAGIGAGYTSTLQALRTIARTEGAAGLYRGLGPTVLTNAPFSAFYYMFYTRLKEALSGEGRPQAAVNFASGAAAAVAATLLTQPADVLRTRIQLGLVGGAAAAGPAAAAAAAATAAAATRVRAAGGARAALAHVFNTQGFAGLFTGAAPRIVKRTAQTALVWTLYEELVPRLSAVWLLAADGAARAAAAAGATAAAKPAAEGGSGSSGGGRRGGGSGGPT